MTFCLSKGKFGTFDHCVWMKKLCRNLKAEKKKINRVALPCWLSIRLSPSFIVLQHSLLPVVRKNLTHHVTTALGYISRWK